MLATVFIRNHPLKVDKELLDKNINTMKEKTEKMNIRFPKEFYMFLKRKAVNEHLSPSTYARKVLMDSLNYNIEEDETNVLCIAEV